MKDGKHLSLAAIIGLVLLFPFFMIYQAAAQQQIIDPVFGSYFSLAALLSLPFSLYVFVGRYGFFNLFNIFTARLFFLFVFLIFSGSVFGWVCGIDKEIVRYNLGSSLRLVSLFFIVFCFDSLRKKQRYAFVTFFLLHSVYILLLSEDRTFVKPAILIDGYIYEYDYQQIALVYLILAIVFLPFMSTIARFLLYVISILALFFIGARSEFYAFFLLIFFVEMFRGKVAVNLFLIFLLLLFIFISLFFVSNFDFSDYRIFSIFSSSGDVSLSARQQLTLYAIDTISENLLFGDYGGYPAGHYAHNGLAVWVDFGFFGFLLLIMILYIPFLSLLRSWSKKDSAEWLQAFSCTSLAIFLLIFAKTHTYGLISVSIALYCIFLLRIKKRITLFSP